MKENVDLIGAINELRRERKFKFEYREIEKDLQINEHEHQVIFSSTLTDKMIKELAERDEKIIQLLTSRLEELASAQPPENFEM